MILRRKLLLAAVGVGAGAAGFGAFRGLHSLPERDADADERFRKLQSAALEALAVTATSRFVDVKEPPLRVQVLEGGAGDPVLLVHGGNSVAVGWAPLMARLQSKFHLFAPDRPGCGLTTMFDYQGVDLRTHAQAYIGGVLDALGLQRVSLVANSMGGFFALAFALAQPDRVARLALLGEPAGSSAEASTFHKLVGTRGVNTLLYSTVLRPPKDAAGARKGMARAKLVANVDRVPEALLSTFAAGAALPGAVVSWITMVECVSDPPGAGLFASKTKGTFSLRPELPKLQVPTLFLWGDKDPFGAPSVGRELAALMPHAQVQVVDDAGHLPWLDQPDFCAQQVAAFLSAT